MSGPSSAKMWNPKGLQPILTQRYRLANNGQVFQWEDCNALRRGLAVCCAASESGPRFRSYSLCFWSGHQVRYGVGFCAPPSARVVWRPRYRMSRVSVLVFVLLVLMRVPLLQLDSELAPAPLAEVLDIVVLSGQSWVRLLRSSSARTGRTSLRAVAAALAAAGVRGDGRHLGLGIALAATLANQCGSSSPSATKSRRQVRRCRSFSCFLMSIVPGAR